MKTETIILALAILFTGFMAGIFFTWSNAVKPGIGKLSDLDFLFIFGLNTLGNILAATLFEKSLSLLTLVFTFLLWNVLKKSKKKIKSTKLGQNEF